jgi:anti-sigma regulatory factor (Ser/Thr protein kinase)
MRQDVKNLIEMQAATREFGEALLAYGVPQERVFDCRLIASELLANVLKHAGSTATLQWLLGEEQVEIFVLSPIPYEPPKESRCSGIYAESGRGLFLIDRFSYERTVTEDGAIKVTVKF